MAIIVVIVIIIIYILAVNEIIREEIFSWMLKVPIEAIAVFDDDLINGSIYFTEDIIEGDIVVEVDLNSTNKDLLGKHTLMIYYLANVFDDPIANLGNMDFIDLGDYTLLSKYTFKNKKLKLRGINNIVGRGIAIHDNNVIISKSVIGYSKI